MCPVQEATPWLFPSGTYTTGGKRDLRVASEMAAHAWEQRQQARAEQGGGRAAVMRGLVGRVLGGVLRGVEPSRQGVGARGVAVLTGTGLLANDVQQKEDAAAVAAAAAGRVVELAASATAAATTAAGRGLGVAAASVVALQPTQPPLGPRSSPHTTQLVSDSAVHPHHPLGRRSSDSAATFEGSTSSSSSPGSSSATVPTVSGATSSSSGSGSSAGRGGGASTANSVVSGERAHGSGQWDELLHDGRAVPLIQAGVGSTFMQGAVAEMHSGSGGRDDSHVDLAQLLAVQPLLPTATVGYGSASKDVVLDIGFDGKRSGSGSVAGTVLGLPSGKGADSGGGMGDVESGRAGEAPQAGSGGGGGVRRAGSLLSRLKGRLRAARLAVVAVRKGGAKRGVGGAGGGSSGSNRRAPWNEHLAGFAGGMGSLYRVMD